MNARAERGNAVQNGIGGVAAGLAGRFRLHPANLQVPSGSFTALVGPNGAGKSTLLHCLAGLLAYTGQVQWLGRDAAHMPRKERGKTLAWLGQSEQPSADMAVADVVMLGRLPHQGLLGAASPADHAAVAQAMQQTQTTAFANRQVGELSGGERQRVLLARALATLAPLLLLDEPLAHLDLPHHADFLAIVRAQTAQGHTVISALHELSTAMQADHLAVMQNGQLLHHGPPQDPATQQALQTAFGGRLAFLRDGDQVAVLPKQA